MMSMSVMASVRRRTLIVASAIGSINLLHDIPVIEVDNTNWGTTHPAHQQDRKDANAKHITVLCFEAPLKSLLYI